MADGGLDVPSKKIVLDVGRVSFYLKIAILGLIIVCLGVGEGAVQEEYRTTDWQWAWTVSSAFLLPIALLITTRFVGPQVAKKVELPILVAGAVMFTTSGALVIGSVIGSVIGLPAFLALGSLCIITALLMAIDAVLVVVIILRG